MISDIRHGMVYMALHGSFLHKTQVLQCIVVFVSQKVCDVCMLHSRVSMQALGLFVEIATSEIYSSGKLCPVRYSYFSCGSAPSGSS